jgi:hypothetical protein
MRAIQFSLLSFFVSVQAWPAVCPSGDDPPLTVTTKAGPVLSVCGFEDREVSSPKNKRAFMEFTVHYTAPNKPEPQKLFTADLADTYWVRVLDRGRGLELEELWFFSEKPQPALSRTITCEGESCKLSPARCIFKIKPNSYPKALAKLEEERKKGKFDEDGEELLDQIFAQALTGDEKAKAFYAAKMLDGFDEAMIEAFTANQKKIQEIKELKCR